MTVFDYAERRRRLAERMAEAGVDLLFLQPSSDLEYLTGVERAIPTFGQSSTRTVGWQEPSSDRTAIPCSSCRG